MTESAMHELKFLLLEREALELPEWIIRESARRTYVRIDGKFVPLGWALSLQSVSEIDITFH